MSNFGNLDDAIRAAESSYCGCYASLTDYARELTEKCTEIPAALVHYIDYEAMGRHMELSGDVFTVETSYHKVHIFRSY